MNKTIRVLMLYRIICELYAKNGRAVSANELKVELCFTDLPLRVSHGTAYSYINELIQLGFVDRIEHGWYIPVDIYQWHMDDIKNG